MFASIVFHFFVHIFIQFVGQSLSCIRPVFSESSCMLSHWEITTEVGDRVLVFKELFGAGFMKHKYTKMQEKKYILAYIRAYAKLSEGIIKI